MKRLDAIGDALAVAFTLLQTDEILQIVSIIGTIISIVISIAFTLWQWWKKAKEDGKIDTSELKDGINIVKDGVEKITETASKLNDKKKGDSK